MCRRSFVFALALVTLGACAGPHAVDTAAPPAPPPLGEVRDAARHSPLRHDVPAALVTAAASVSDDEATLLAAFYQSRDFAPVWFDGGAYAELRAEVAPRWLGAATLAPPADAATRARQEVALTLAALREVATGDATDPVAGAVAVGLAEAVERATPPAVEVAAVGGQHAAIARYRTIVAAGGWPTVAEGETIEPGMVDPRVPALRRRLAVSGDFAARDVRPAAGGADGGAAATTHDAAMVAAVERFQARHGLEVDGVVGPATLRALNVPATARLAQLERAEARLVELGRRLGERYVMVNVPAFELRYVRDHQIRHRARVVVGSVANPTPAFADTIEHLIFNPYWHVPTSIAREELVFDFKEDAAAMAARGFQLIDSSGGVQDPRAVDWNAVSPTALPFRVRQGPGAANALGHVKFMFPNDHAIYLHDTPSRHLFARASRAFSHGCIRVEDPMTLAERLLETDGWSRDDIDAWVAAGNTRRVGLRRPVPVHLVYVTAWRDETGAVQFRRDIYGRERGAYPAVRAGRGAVPPAAGDGDGR